MMVGLAICIVGWPSPVIDLDSAMPLKVAEALCRNLWQAEHTVCSLMTGALHNCSKIFQ